MTRFLVLLPVDNCKWFVSSSKQSEESELALCAGSTRAVCFDWSAPALVEPGACSWQQGSHISSNTAESEDGKRCRNVDVIGRL